MTLFAMRISQEGRIEAKTLHLLISASPPETWLPIKKKKKSFPPNIADFMRSVGSKTHRPGRKKKRVEGIISTTTPAPV